MSDTLLTILFFIFPPVVFALVKTSRMSSRMKDVLFKVLLYIFLLSFVFLVIIRGFGTYYLWASGEIDYYELILLFLV